jgi:hypothetical protein
MSDLVTRLRAEIDDDVSESFDRLLDEAADRIADLELALVELSRTDGSPRNVPTPSCWQCVREWRRAERSEARQLAGHNHHQTRSTKRLSERLGADMSAIRIIILVVAGALAYAGLIAGIVKFATLVP